MPELETQIELIIIRSRVEDESFLMDSKKAAREIVELVNLTYAEKEV